jgi:hypothetical protein
MVWRFRIFVFGMLLSLFACSGRPRLPQLPKPKVKPTPTQPSNISVEVNPGGPAVLTTSAAEFQVQPDGYVQALLLKDGRRLTLDEPRVGAPSGSDYAVVGRKEIYFTLDFQQARVLETIGKLGVGKRLEIFARPLGPSGTNLERVLILEAYDKFPNILITEVEYKNIGTTGIKIEKTMDQRHRFSARPGEGKARTWDLWSYQSGSSEEGGGEVVRLTPHFSRRNVVGLAKEHRETSRLVVAFWTQEVGEAIGPLGMPQIATAIPVKTASDGRVDAQIEFEPNTMLHPGETYSNPRNFLSIYEGDSLQPAHLWAALPPTEGWEPLEPQSPTR